MSLIEIWHTADALGFGWVGEVLACASGWFERCGAPQSIRGAEKSSLYQNGLVCRVTPYPGYPPLCYIASKS
jgi:hypothetical protein